MTSDAVTKRRRSRRTPRSDVNRRLLFAPEERHVYSPINHERFRALKERMRALQGGETKLLALEFATEFESAPDEEGVVYGYVAEWVSYPDDFSAATFSLRKEARFHDGSPITPEDVAFSLTALKSAHPRYGYYYKNVVSAEKTGEREVTFKFDVKGNRELPFIISELPILSKTYWEGKGANGETRDITKSSL